VHHLSMATIRRSDPPPPEFWTLDAGEGEKVEVKLIVNPRARRVAVRIDPVRREAIAIAPSSRQTARAVAFANERVGWIATQLAALPEAHPFSHGAVIPVRGLDTIIERVPGRAPPVLEYRPYRRLIVGAPDAETFALRVKRYLVAEAKADFTARVAAHAETLRVAPGKMTVKDTKSRWGSCSVDGVLAFSWRLIFAPPYVLDYLAAHEVAHLKEMNHSPRFWAQVKKCIPDHARGRAWLRRHGQMLHAYGAEI
jgi:predicted metal-dependent hydrolase